jgi:hypothetical protein
MKPVNMKTGMERKGHQSARRGRPLVTVETEAVTGAVAEIAVAEVETVEVEVEIAVAEVVEIVDQDEIIGNNIKRASSGKLFFWVNGKR